MNDMLLGIDMGTTHCKAGLFREDGSIVRTASRPTVTLQDKNKRFYYDPEQVWETIASAIKEITSGEKASAIRCIGITSMAESGLLIDVGSGKPKTHFIPWFDTRTKPQADRIAAECDIFQRFCASGLNNSYKYGLHKLLWTQQHQPDALDGTVWLSMADYIAFRLTGCYGTDYTLAARTYAFDIQRKEWDNDWIRHVGLKPELFPEAYPSTAPMGKVLSGMENELGLADGTPVVIAGHDHVCASLAVGAIEPGKILDSIGTAETLVGVLPDRALKQSDYESGLNFGRHVLSDRLFWMGGNSSSGGSVEWMRKQLSEEPMSYEQLLTLLEEAVHGPTGILYFPYLSGCSAPMPDTNAQGAFIGLKKEHTRADLLKAVLEGTAYQMQWIRRSAEDAGGFRVDAMTAVGGGTRNKYWMQIKADVSGFPLEASSLSEATLLGAALAAGIGSGVYGSAEEACEQAARRWPAEKYEPNSSYHSLYMSRYEHGYLPLQQPMREYYNNN